MTEPTRGRADHVVGAPAAAGADAADRPGPFEQARRPRRPHVRWSVVAAVFVGGCVGGLIRYVVTRAWPAPPHGFPWAVFTVNLAGAFVLAVLVVLAADVAGPSTYLRPLLGTGFCGALTTFSSVVVAADELVAHGHSATAAAYLAATVGCGLAAGMCGVVVGRSFGAYRRRYRQAGGG